MSDLSKWATWREVHAQPAIWLAWGAAFDVAGVRAWINAQTFDEVWFCGAGTSAYIGDIIAAELPNTRSVPSTDLVSRPHYFLRDVKPLVVSFGRSGNSAESIGTLDVLDALAPDAPRLHITCNKDGALATRIGSGPCHVITLPDATHDAGFAMTSSFSTMLLTALAVFDAPCDFADRLSVLANQLGKVLSDYETGTPAKRAVYVGTGPLSFAAREAALKVLELSAGQIPAIWDSTLGFRHGPKSFVTSGTEITVFASGDSPAKDYDIDLADEVRAQFPDSRVRVVGPNGDTDIALPFGTAWAAPLYVATAQVTSVRWAAALGMNVDDPFVGQGTLSRVVSGVKLYPVKSS